MAEVGGRTYRADPIMRERIDGDLAELIERLDLAAPPLGRDPWRDHTPQHAAQSPFNLRFALASLPAALGRLRDRLLDDPALSTPARVVDIAETLDRALRGDGLPVEAVAEAERAVAHLRVSVARWSRFAGERATAAKGPDRSDDAAVVVDVLDAALESWHAQSVSWDEPALFARERWLNRLEQIDLLPGLHARGLRVVDEVTVLHLDGSRLAVLMATGTERRPVAVQRERAVVDDRVRSLVLARADLRNAVRLLDASDSRRGRMARWFHAPLPWLLSAAVVALVPILAGAPLGGWSTVAATVLMLVPGLLVVVDTVRGGPVATYPWILRAPAACAVGFGLVVAFHEGLRMEAAGVGLRSGVAAGALVLVGVVLTLDARAHAGRGVGVRRVLRSSGRATSLAALHAVVLSAAGIRWVYPLIDEAERVEQVLARSGLDGVVTVLVTAMLSMAVGVLLQSLWDDEPMTAPLGSLRWR